MSYRYLLRFSKTDRLIFIGHLDLLRLLHKCARIADLPVMFSEGFNPHMLVTIALPLSVGMAGMNEYAVIELSDDVPTDGICERLNAAAPGGLLFTGARPIAQNEKKPASAARYAAYEARFSGIKKENLAAVINETRNAAEVLAENPKTGEKIDIKPDILEINLVSEDTVSMLISAGSAKNLKPQVAGAYIARRIAAPVCSAVTYTRAEIYKLKKNGEPVSLFSA